MTAPCALPSGWPNPGSGGRSRAPQQIRRRRTHPPVLGEELALDLAGGVCLEHVALLDVGVIAQDDSAVKPARDLANVVVEAPQAGDLALIDDRSVAHQADLRAAGDLALGDVRAGYRSNP